MRRTTNSALWAWTMASSYLTPAHGQTSTFQSKRGLAYLGDTHASDESLLFSATSSIDWYYNWSPNPVSGNPLPFVPLIHGLDDAASTTTMDTINNLPASSSHLLTFNEPDGTTSSGGSAISPSDAARSYIDNILPMRTAATTTSGSRDWNISHPATTGSSSGLAWLHEFNASCWELNPASGCPTDFVALHWYGDFAGLASWLGTLREFYVTNSSSGAASKDITFWITELALPQQDADQTVDMLNQSISYLDSLEYVAAYAWFGADRKSGSWDGFTGGNVAMFSSGGKLTDVGALYLGGKEAGFKAGMTGAAGGVHVSVLVVAVTAMCMIFNTW